MNIHYDQHGAVVAVEMAGTRYSPEALRVMAARVGELETLTANLRDTLDTLATCNDGCINCREMAQLAIEGKFGDE